MRKALQELPPDLAAAYDSAIDRIRSKGVEIEELVFKGLAWLFYTPRALHACELQEALSVETGATAPDCENILEFDALIECFSGLVVAEGSTVHFVHYTLQEYLSNRLHLLPEKTCLAKICLTYALFDEFESGPIEKSNTQLYVERTQKYPLLEYVAHNWFIFVRGSGESDLEVLEYLQSLFASRRKLEALLQAQYAVKQEDRSWIDKYPRDSSPLHVVASAGLPIVAEMLLRKDGPEDLRRKDSYGRIPLHEAIIASQVDLLTIFMGDDVDLVHYRDNEGMTALHHAAVSGNKHAMKLLLEAGADVTAQDRCSCTPLERALTDSSREEDSSTWSLLKALIEVGGSALYKPMTFTQWTALHVASMLGFEEAVRDLLQVGFKVETGDVWGFNALHRAVQIGHAGTVKALVDSVSGTLNRTIWGATPLHIAATTGDEDVVDMLLSSNASDASLRDFRGWTLLHFAALGGHISIVRKLLPVTGLVFSGGRLEDKNPVHLAMWGGEKQVMEYLLETEPALEDDRSSVFQLDTIRHLAQPTDTSKEMRRASGFLDVVARHYLAKKRFDLASICFDLAVLTHPDNEQAREPKNVYHSWVYCNRCMTEPIQGFCYRCTRCSTTPWYYLCSECFEKKWLFAHPHDQYIQIPSSSTLPTVEELLETLRRASE